MRRKSIPRTARPSVGRSKRGIVRGGIRTSASPASFDERVACDHGRRGCPWSFPPRECGPTRGSSTCVGRRDRLDRRVECGLLGDGFVAGCAPRSWWERASGERSCGADRAGPGGNGCAAQTVAGSSRRTDPAASHRSRRAVGGRRRAGGCVTAVLVGSRARREGPVIGSARRSRRSSGDECRGTCSPGISAPPGAAAEYWTEPGRENPTVTTCVSGGLKNSGPARV